MNKKAGLLGHLSTLVILTNSSLVLADTSSTLVGPAAECERPLDVVLCLDTSGSIGDENWAKVLSFVIDIASAFDFSRARFGVVCFDTTAVVQISLGQYATFADFAVDVAANGTGWYTSGQTFTYDGIELSQQEIEARGRSAEIGAAHLMLVITDGQSNGGRPPGEAALPARNNGTTISVITIGPPEKFKPNEVESIVGLDHLDLIFPIEAWSGVSPDNSILRNITTAACGAPVRPPDEGNVTSQLSCNETFPVVSYPNVSRPLTIVASISQGSIQVCHSYLVRTPSAADAPGLTVCSVVGARDAHISTTTAYPAANASDPAQAGGRLSLFIAPRCSSLYQVGVATPALAKRPSTTWPSAPMPPEKAMSAYVYALRTASRFVTFSRK